LERGAHCRAFVSQLQTTFIKHLPDPSAEVRKFAAENLGLLTNLSPRVEQLVVDLLNALG
jgi:hypothetical protein